MNKKILIGCAIVALVGVIAGAIGVYYFVVRPAREYVASLSRLGEISDLNTEVESTQSFAAPEDGLLTDAQVERFVRVQRSIVDGMGTQLGALKEKYAGFDGSGGNQPGFGELVEFWKDFSNTVLQVKRSQVDALNQEGFSLDEYRWVRNRFYQALGANFLSVNLENLAEAIQQQDPELLEEAPEAEMAPQPNRDLVRPYEEEAASWLAYAWLGL